MSGAKRKTYSRSRSRGGKRSKIGRANVSRISAVAPDQMIVTMRYCERINLVDGFVKFGQYKFRAGSIFDPNQTAVGHQPMGHDEWATLYQQYRVIGSSCEVLAVNADATEGAYICIVPSEGTTSYTDISTMIESPYAVYSQSGLEAATNGTRLKNPYMTTVKFKGDKAAMFDKDFAANMGTNPVSDWYWHIGVENAKGSANHDVDLLVIIEYKVLLWDRAQLTAS